MAAFRKKYNKEPTDFVAALGGHNGMNVAAGFPVVQVQDNALKLVWPKADAEAPVIHPFPLWRA